MPEREEIAVQKNKAGKAFGTTVGRAVLTVFLSILMFAIFLLGVMVVLCHGPSENARNLFVMSTNETSAIKFLPRLVMKGEDVDAILHPTPAAEEPAEKDDFVELSFEDGSSAEEPQAGQVVVSDDPSAQSGEWLEILDIKGATYKGKMMLVHDPSKVIVATLDYYPSPVGLYLTEFIDKYNAIGGTNAGGFYDPNGGGTGGTPEYDGIVIRDGNIAWGSAGGSYINVIGFDADHILHVGDMTGQEAIDLGLQTAVSFSAGPVLVKDGVMQTGLGGGVNPRTCLGQTADGTVIMLVLEGRKPDSLGATYDDIAEIMYEYGAVNAANLDGGSSSLMYYNGEQITRGSNLIGKRPVPTAILVLN